MGGRSRRKGGRKKHQDREETPRQSTYELTAKGNFRYECYYALQGIHNEHWNDGKLVPCETDAERNEERLRWLTALKASLPASFRIGKDVPVYFQKQLSQELEEFIRSAVAFEPKADDVDTNKRGRSAADFAALVDTKCHKLSFLPFAYQLSLDRVALRRNPALKELQKWLTTHAAEGNITRQETVSMIPPVLLNVQCNDRVLDMCAAPGSKTSQMLEDMSASDAKNETGTPSTGVLVANDCNTKRAYMLASQLRRILHYHPVALITATHAQNFPNVVSYDKILCDVPCTGDGTSRKNIDVWLKWSNGGALGLHALQLQIAKRGIDLLKVGGTMCYSTCSQNPIENEAVVAELLRRGGLELVSKQVDGFLTRPGRITWKVLYDGKRQQQPTPSTTKPTSPTPPNPPVFQPTSWKDEDLLKQGATVNMSEFESFDEVPPELQHKIRKTVFPPTVEEAKSMHLERCIRCLPQDNNTGGFFSALLRKVSPMTRKDREEEVQEDGNEAKRQKRHSNTVQDVDATDTQNFDSASKPGGNSDDKSRSIARETELPGKDNFVPVSDDVLDSIADFYGMTDDFPRQLIQYRALGEMNTLYYVSPQVMELMRQGIQDRITIISTGLKTFARNAKRKEYVHGDYRICQESIHILEKYMTKRKFTVPLADLQLCLGAIGDQAVNIKLLSNNTQDKLNGLEPGSFLMIGEGHSDDADKRVMACMWRNRAQTVNCLVGKIEIDGMRKKIDAIQNAT